MFRRFLIIVAFAASSIAFFFFILLKWLRYRTYLGDYLIFWRAGAGWPLYHDLHQLVFPYPPTALFLVRPFGLLPFWWALAAWSLTGVAALYLSARLLVARQAVLIGIMSASCLWLALDGQTTLFVAPLIVLGVVARQPWLAGLCFAAAGVVKPQSAVAVPIALIAARQFRAIIWGAFFAAILVNLSMVIWGAGLWPRWLNILHTYPALLVEWDQIYADAGLAGLAAKARLPIWLYLIGVPLGCITVWRTFSRDAPAAERYAALVCGSVLLSPHTLAYDLATLSIVSTAFLLDKERSPMMWRASAMIISEVLTAPGVVLMALCLCRRSNDWRWGSVAEANRGHQ
jgi:hypothetical protein